MGYVLQSFSNNNWILILVGIFVPHQKSFDPFHFVLTFVSHFNFEHGDFFIFVCMLVFLSL